MTLDLCPAALPSRPPAPPGPAGPGPRGPAGAGPGRGQGQGATRGPAPAPPSDTHRHGSSQRSVAALARAFAELYCEVEAGQRPRAQLEPIMTPLLAARLAPVWVRPGPLPAVVAVTGGFLSAGRYAAVAVVRRGRRCGALAIELERRRQAWTVVEAARPEDGVLPAPEAAPPLAEPDAFDLVCGDIRVA